MPTGVPIFPARYGRIRNGMSPSLLVVIEKFQHLADLRVS
jgi:hypothetical protein